MRCGSESWIKRDALYSLVCLYVCSGAISWLPLNRNGRHVKRKISGNMLPKTKWIDFQVVRCWNGYMHFKQLNNLSAYNHVVYYSIKEYILSNKATPLRINISCKTNETVVSIINSPILDAIWIRNQTSHLSVYRVIKLNVNINRRKLQSTFSFITVLKMPHRQINTNCEWEHVNNPHETCYLLFCFDVSDIINVFVLL